MSIKFEGGPLDGRDIDRKHCTISERSCIVVVFPSDFDSKEKPIMARYNSPDEYGVATWPDETAHKA